MEGRQLCDTDLGAIAKKLERHHYLRAGEWLADVRLVFENCRAFNAASSPVAQCAHVLEVFFDNDLLKTNLPALLGPSSASDVPV